MTIRELLGWDRDEIRDTPAHRGKKAMSDILENGEDVTQEPSRSLILRSVNLSLQAASVVEDVKSIKGQLARIEDLLTRLLHSGGGSQTSTAE